MQYEVRFKGSVYLFDTMKKMNCFRYFIRDYDLWCNYFEVSYIAGLVLKGLKTREIRKEIRNPSLWVDSEIRKQS
jgi:hypothetical protein